MKETVAQKREKHRKFLDLIQAGHDPAAAAIGAGLPLSVTKLKALEGRIQDALEIGTARLRSKITSMALAGNDVRALENVLAYRQTQIAKAEIDIRHFVERVIVHQDKCPSCGFKLAGDASEGYSKRTRPSDTPHTDLPSANLPTQIDAATEHVPSPAPIRNRKAAMFELLQGGNVVVEAPRN